MAETLATPAAATPAKPADAPVVDGVATEVPSAADAVKNAMAKVQTKTDEAAAVLRGDPPNKATSSPSGDEPTGEEVANPRSESAKKGAETRRKNKEAAAQAETDAAAKALKDTNAAELKDANKRADAAEKKLAKGDKPAPDAAAEPKAAPVEGAAPERFSKEAKADWEATPQTVRDQVTRLQDELTSGIEKHKERASKYDAIEPYEQTAAQHGATIPVVLEDYSKMSEMLQRNPIEGIQYLAERHGMSLTKLAEQVLGQQSNESYKAMEDQLILAKQKLVGHEAKEAEERQKLANDNLNLVDQFRIDNADFDELWQDVKYLLETHKGLGDTPEVRLENAMIRARNMAGKPTPAQKESTSDAQTVDDDKASEDAQTVKANKTSAGSASAEGAETKKPAGSAREAVERAMKSARKR